MINHILLVFSCVIIYEFIQLVNFTNIVKSNLKIYQKILKLFQYKNVSDFKKEKLILNYSKTLFVIINVMNIYLFWILFLSLWAIVPLMIIKGRIDEAPKIQTAPKVKAKKKGWFN